MKKASVKTKGSRARPDKAEGGSRQKIGKTAMEGNGAPDSEQLRKMDAWWRAANYLSVGQTYLYANPLLKEPLKKEHVKPRLVGHWGTTPGLNFIYVHLNRVI